MEENINTNIGGPELNDPSKNQEVPNKKGNNHKKRIIIIVGLVLIIAVGVGILLYIHFNNEPSANTKNHTVSMNKPRCGDGACASGESCSSCLSDCGICPAVNGESHFGIGIHSIVRTDLNEEILELGDIYVGLNLWDVAGWHNVKEPVVPVSLCQSCCNPDLSITCSCKPGTFFFCTPASRDGLVMGEVLADTFYELNHNIFFSIGVGSYGKNEPKSPEDINSMDYPANEEVYKEYIKYLVQQYPNVEYWGVLSEADFPHAWSDTADNYARLVALTSSEIKRYCPDCKVGISLASVTPTDEWFSAIVSVRNDIDFLDLHQYHSNNMSELKKFEASGLTRWKESFPGMEIVSIETGIPSDPITFKDRVWELGTSEERQAKDIIKYFTMMYNAGYSKIYNYLIDHDFVPGVLDIYESIGVLDENGNKRSSFQTYQLMIRKLDYFTSITKLADGQYKYTFANENPVYVLWRDTLSCKIPSEISGTVRVTDYLGNEETKNVNQIILTSSPVFVEGI